MTRILNVAAILAVLLLAVGVVSYAAEHVTVASAAVACCVGAWVVSRL